MFGRVLKLGCFVVVGTLFLTGCLLSSSIEQHMADDYNGMKANVEAQSAADNPDPATQLAILQGFIHEDMQEAARYNMLLLGFVVVVLGASSLVISTGTLYFMTRYLQPIEKKYNDALATSRMWRMNNQQSPFSNTTHHVRFDDDKTIPHNPMRAQSDNRNQGQSHCERLTKRYKVDNK
jgi:hypothetical protein